MSIKVKILVPVFVMIAYMAFSAFMVHKVISDQKSVAPVINIAGRQRMLTQKMTKELLFYLNTKDPAFVEQMRNTMNIFEMSLNALIDSGKVPTSLNLQNTKWLYIPGAKGKIREQLLKVKDLWEQFKAHVYELLRGVNVEQNLRWIEKNNLVLLSTMNKAVFMLQNDAERKLAELERFQYIGLGIGLVATLLVILSVFMVTSRIDRGIEAISAIVEGGVIHLDARVHAGERDEIGRILETVDRVIRKMAEKIKELSHRSGVIAGQVPVGLNVDVNVNVVSEEYKMMTEDLANALNELDIAIKDLVEEASRASVSASEATEIAREGMERTKDSARRSEEVSKAIEGLAKETRRLEEITGQISRILQVINDISDQTGLLALNAAIEAARAGEHGRGFAVVADEIRKLAEQTQKATKDIEEMLSHISSTVDRVSNMGEAAINFVEEQVKAVEDAKHSFEVVLDSISQLNELIVKVSSTAEEQSAAVSQIAETSDSLKKGADEIVENIKASSDAMRRVATSIKTMFDVLKDVSFGGAEAVAEAVERHADFVTKVFEYCLGYLSEAELDLKSHDSCPFASFLYSDDGRRILGERYSRIEELHRRVHEAAFACVEAVKDSDRKRLVDVTDELADASSRLLVELAEVVKSV